MASNATASPVPPALPPLDQYNLIATALEGWLFGLNCVVYSVTVYILGQKRLPNKSLAVLTSSTALLAVSAAHFIVTLVQLFVAFIIVPQSGTPEATSLYYLAQSKPLALCKLVLFDHNTFAANLVLVWRTYVVWGKTWSYVVIPLFGVCSHYVLSLIAIGYVANPSITFFDPPVAQLGVAAFVLDVSCNVILTSLIAFRLWWTGRRVSGMIARKSRYTFTIVTIAESGAILVASGIALLTLYLMNSGVVTAAMTTHTQVATLAPLLVVVRVGLSGTHRDSKNAGISTEQYTSAMRRAPSTAVQFTRECEGDSQWRLDGDDYPLGVVHSKIADTD